METLTEAQRALFATGGCSADYDVLKPIGKGKFAVVHKARRRRDGQLVALKEIAAFGVADARARDKTLKELRLVQAVRHNNIVQYLDAFVADDALFIAFEWAAAGDLKRQIRKAAEHSARFDERTIWRYFCQLCAALQYLHSVRIMHRDLKPANVLLTLEGVVKVGDLGLGRHLSEATVQAHSKVGTPLYMSPEVLRGDGYDWKSDVWSLGCILYELAMLRSPFKADGLNLYGLFQKITKGDYEPIAPIYSDHLRRLAMRMLSLVAADRPTMDEVWGLCQVRPTSATLVDKTERIPAQTLPVQDNELAAAPATAATVVVPSTTVTATTNPPGVFRRRKVIQQREVPTPQDAQPTSSRPPSSASSSSSRPPSSQRSTSDTSDAVSAELAAHTHAEARMELLFERLTLLHYDVELQKRLSRTHFLAPASSSLSSQQVRAHSQFADMRALATWLLRLLGVDVAPALPPAHPPLAAVQVLLLGAERAGVGASIADLSAPALTSGAGESVCVLLDALCEQVLRTQPQWYCRLPVYPAESVDELAVQDDLEVTGDDAIHHNVRGGLGGADWGESTASVPGGCDNSDMGDDREDDRFAHWLVVTEDDARLDRHGDSRTIHDPVRFDMIPARVDPVAWQREVARMTPRLRVRVAERTAACPNGASWCARLEQLQHNVGLIVSTVPGVRRGILEAQEVRRIGYAVLSCRVGLRHTLLRREVGPTNCVYVRRMCQRRQADVRRIETLEKRLNERLVRVRRRFHEHATKLTATQDAVGKQQERVQRAALAAARLQAEAAVTADAVAAQHARVTDTTQLAKLKQQLRRLESENQQLAVQAEVLRYYVALKQRAAATTHARTSPGGA